MRALAVGAVVVAALAAGPAAAQLPSVPRPPSPPGLPPISGLPDLSRPGVPPAVQALQIHFSTSYRAAPGVFLNREHASLPFVPTVLDVDRDPAPDLIATLAPTGPDRVALNVREVPLSDQPLPVSIEAVVRDPLNALPRDNVYFGYDARASDAPANFEATIRTPLLATSLTGGSATTSIDVAFSSEPRPSVAVVGGLFDGRSSARSNRIEGRLDYTPMPTGGGMALTIGADRYAIRLAETDPAVEPRLVAHARYENGDEETQAEATVQRLPSSLGVEYATSSGVRTITYDAAAPVAAVDVEYTSREGRTVEDRAVAHLRGLPRRIHVAQSARGADVTTVGGRIGSAEVAFANGEPRLLALDHPYAYLTSDGTVESQAFRVDDLASARVHVAPSLFVDMTLAPRRPLPFVARIEEPGLRIDARAEHLPSRIELELDMRSGGYVEYHGFGSRIGRITATVRSDRPLFGDVRRIEATVRDLPPDVTAVIASDTGAIDFHADAAIGEAEVLLTSGPSLSLPPGQAGARLRINPTVLDREFVAFGRLFDVRRIRFQPEPLTARIELARAQRVTLEAIELPGVGLPTETLTATIDRVPAGFVEVTKGGLNPCGYAYSASAPIDRLDLDIRNFFEVDPGMLQNLDVGVSDVPRQFALYDGSACPDGRERMGVGVLDAGGRIGAADLRAWGRTTEPALPPADRNFFEMIKRDSGVRLSVRAHVEDLERGVLSTIGDFTDLDVDFAEPVPRPIEFGLDLMRFGTPRTELRARGEIPEPPQRLGLQLRAPEPRITLTGSPRPSDGIAIPSASFRFGLDRRGPGVRDGASALGGAFTLTDLPSRTVFCATGDPDTGCDRQAPDRFSVDPGIGSSRRTVTLHNDLTLFIAPREGSGPIGVDGIVCLPAKSIPDTTSDDICLAGVAEAERRQVHKVDLRNVRLQDLRFELGSGNSVERDGGDPVEDGLLKLWLDTAASTSGVSFDLVEYRNGNSTWIWLSNPGPGLRAERFFVVADIEPLPPGIEQASGRLRCGGFAGPFVRLFDLNTTLNLTSIIRAVACS